jgi:CDGSH-type Zn-finger protein
MEPLKFVHEGETTEEAILCGCKNNKKESGAYCDGSHKYLNW